MTAPAIPAAPAARAPSTGGAADAKSTGSAAPFASALDGALSEGRAAVDDGTAGDGESPDPGAPGTPVVTGEAGAVEVPLAVAVPVNLWALALGSPVAGQPAALPPADAALAVGPLLPGQAAGEAVAPAAPAAPGAPALPTAAVPPTAASAVGSAVPAAGLPPDLVVVPEPGAGTPTAAGTGTVSTGPVPGTAGPTAPPVPVVPAPVAPAPSGPVPDPAAGTTGQAAAAALPGAASSSATGADAGSAGQDPGGAAPGDGSVELTTAVAGAAPTSAPAATGDVDGATGDAASLSVGGQVARHVAVLRGSADGSHTMTLVLTPETLGPVEIAVTVSKGVVDLVLRGAHEQGRAALMDALPDLRRDLEAAGLTTSKVEVARDSSGSWLDRHAAGQQAQQGFGDRPGQQGPQDGRSRPWLRPADSEGSRSVPANRSTSSGVDIRV